MVSAQGSQDLGCNPVDLRHCSSCGRYVMIESHYGLLQATKIEKKRSGRQLVRGNLTKLVAVKTGNGRDHLRLMVFLVVTLC
jgi:hypothetical protein